MAIITQTGVKFQASRFTNPRDNDKRIVKQPAKMLTGPREHFFTNRIVNYWNYLSYDIFNAPLVNSFKKKLDDFIRDNPNLFV